MLHSSLSVHTEAVQQQQQPPHTASHVNSKTRPVGESRMLLLD
jgi:hypothetical protein